MKYTILKVQSKNTESIYTYNKEKDKFFNEKTQRLTWYHQKHIISELLSSQNPYNILEVELDNGIILKLNEFVDYNIKGTSVGSKNQKILNFNTTTLQDYLLIELIDSKSLNQTHILGNSYLNKPEELPKNPLYFTLSEISEVLTPILDEDVLEEVLKDFKGYKSKQLPVVNITQLELPEIKIENPCKKMTYIDAYSDEDIEIIRQQQAQQEEFEQAQFNAQMQDEEMRRQNAQEESDRHRDNLPF